MSITDIAAGRMVQAPRTFGARRVPPMPTAPRPQPAPSPLWQTARQFLATSWTRLQLLSRQGLQFPAWLPAFWRQCAARLARTPALTLRSVKWLAAALRPSETWSREAAIRALLHSNASATFVRLLVYLSALAGLALVAAHLWRSAPPVVEAGPTAPAVEWMNVAKPFPAFSLPLSELADSGHGYALRRHVSGGGRQDILSWGELQDAAPHLMVEIYRPGPELSGFGSAVHEIAARLPGIDAAVVTPAGALETKFGDVSLVEFSLGARQCLGFVRAYDDPQLQILGWQCASGSAPDRELTDCALDRLTLLSAGSEPKVRELFARAELKRNFCGQRSHLLTPTPKLGPSAALPDIKRGRVASH